MLKNLMIFVVATIFVCCGIGIYSEFSNFFGLTFYLLAASTFLSLILFVVVVVNRRKEKKSMQAESICTDVASIPNDIVGKNNIVGFRVVAENGYCIFDKTYLGVTDVDEVIKIASVEVANPNIDSFSVRTEGIFAGGE